MPVDFVSHLMSIISLEILNSLKKTGGGGGRDFFMLAKKKLRFRGAKCCAQDHTAGVWKSWDWSPGLSEPRSHALAALSHVVFPVSALLWITELA